MSGRGTAGSYDPPTNAEETEGTAPTVEVRVVWGGDLLRVLHLDPRRSFHLGEDGCELAVDGERRGARRVPVVLAGPASVSVIAPRGASGSIVTATGVRGSVEHAVEEGLAEAFEGAVPGARILLTPGARVSLTLPSRAAGTAYRAAPDHAPGAAPLVLEIALVNGARVVGRSFSMRGSGRLLASTALVAGAVAAWLGLGAAVSIPSEADLEAGSIATIRALQEAYRPVALAEAEEQAALLADSPPASHSPAGTIGLLWSPGDDREFCAFVPDPALSDGLFLSCDVPRHWGIDPVLDVEPDVAEADYRGLGLGGPPSSEDDRWSRGAFGGRPPTRRPRVSLGLPEVSGGLPREVVQRVTRESFGRLRRCYERALRDNPYVQGAIVVRFTVGRDGAVSNLDHRGSDIPERRVVSCVDRTFDTLRFPRPDTGTVSVNYRLLFTPAS